MLTLFCGKPRWLPRIWGRLRQASGQLLAALLQAEASLGDRRGRALAARHVAAAGLPSALLLLPVRQDFGLGIRHDANFFGQAQRPQHPGIRSGPELARHWQGPAEGTASQRGKPHMRGRVGVLLKKRLAGHYMFVSFLVFALVLGD